MEHYRNLELGMISVKVWVACAMDCTLWSVGGREDIRLDLGGPTYQICIGLFLDVCICSYLSHAVSIITEP